MKISVEIRETYEGSCHYYMTIHLPGYGANHPGFKLYDIEKLECELGKEWQYILGAQTFRPEYAKAMKRGLESVEFH